jgi:hypothetical protein
MKNPVPQAHAVVMTRLALAALLAISLLAVPPAGAAQRREHLTPEEIELVRDNQELDKRTAVFVRAAERRLLAATDPAAAARESEKEKEKWGEVKGTRAQLVYDISKILDEAVVNIDDVSARDASSSLLRKSLFRLSEAAARLLPQLAALRESARDEKERDTLEHAIETAQEIVEAARSHGVTAEDLKTKETKKGKKDN